MVKTADLVIIGAGIVGLAVGYKYLQKYPQRTVIILEKEKQIAAHQTGNNSGVIHTGIYYKPGSLKAKNCLDGVEQMHRFCKEENIPIDSCGKVIVATAPSELGPLEELYRRGQANGVKDLKLIGPEQIQEIEPAATNALKGLHSPHTAIVDFKAVAQALLHKIERLGGVLITEAQCVKILPQSEGVVLATTKGDIICTYSINCGGVWADDIARLSGCMVKERMIPFRGEYYCLADDAAKKIRGLIYPVANPAFPFLGVHLTRKIDGRVEAGPNAVLAFAKEGYALSNIDIAHCARLIAYPGFWKMAVKYWKTGLYEVYRSLSKQEFLKSLQRLVPELSSSDLVSGGAGVRAQLVNPDGTLCDDFHILRSPRMIHVLNAPSPAATASLAIADSLLASML